MRDIFESYLIHELVLIGFVSIVVEFLVYKILTGEFPSRKLSHFNKMLIGAFLVGFLIHLIFEVLGFNEKWCRFTYKN